MLHPDILDHMVEGALDALMWSELDDKGEPLDDTHDLDDIDPQSRRMFAEAVEAMALSTLPDTLVMLDHYAASDRGVWWSDGSLWGHDFTLTSNGHGAGFWDRGEKSGAAERISGMCVSGYDLCLGDDGHLYIS